MQDAFSNRKPAVMRLRAFCLKRERENVESGVVYGPIIPHKGEKFVNERRKDCE